MGAIPLKAQSFSIPGGLAGTQATLRMMRSVALAGSKSPTVRTLALSLVKSLPPRDTLSEAKALFQWVRDNVRFVQDVNNVETVQTTDYTLSVMQGDCDDKTTLLAALNLSIGLPFRFVAVGQTPSNFCHVLGQVQAAGKWYYVEPSEPGPVPFGQQKRRMPAVLIMDVTSGGYVNPSLGALGAVTLQYGFDPFAPDGGYNDVTKAQWDAFFSNVTGDAHDRLVTAALESPSLMQAFYGMVTGVSDPFINFNTDPAPPFSMGLPAQAVSGGAGGGGGGSAGGGTIHSMTGTHYMLQGLGATGVPQTTWNWLYNAVKTGAAKAGAAWSVGPSVTRWDQQFNSQQRFATQVANVAAVVGAAVGIGYAAAATGVTGSAGTATVAPTTIAPAAVSAAPVATVTPTAAIDASSVGTLNAAADTAAGAGTAATSTGAGAAAAATGGIGSVASVASTAGTIAKAATALLGTAAAVKTVQDEQAASQAAIAANNAVQVRKAQQVLTTSATAPAKTFNPLTILGVLGLGLAAYLM